MQINHCLLNPKNKTRNIQEESMSKRVIVVGAGIAGLTAAYTLKNTGCEVLVIEKEPTPGGRIRSDFIEGFTLDIGAQFFTNKYKNTLALIDELRMTQEVVPPSGNSAIYLKGRIIESRYSFIHLMFQFKGLNFFSKLKMGKVRFDTFRNRSLLDFYAIEKSAPLDDESIYSYILREIGEDALEYYFQPMVFSHPEKTSKALLLTLASIAPVELCAIVSGNGNLTQRLADGLDVIYNTQVLEINCLNREHPTLKLNRGNKEETQEADAVISAIPAPQLLEIAKGFPEDVYSFLQKVKYEPYIATSFALKKAILPSVSELNIPRKELSIIKSIAIEQNKSARRVPKGKGLITATVIGEPAHRLMRQGRQKAIESIIHELKFIYPEIRDNIIFSRIYYHPYGEPQFYPGYIRYLKDFKKSRDKTGPIFFAGDYLAGPFIETALTSGLEAARKVISFFS
jgi:protoporphyrinogen/coproporphyrinogen III oxidase